MQILTLADDKTIMMGRNISQPEEVYFRKSTGTLHITDI